MVKSALKVEFYVCVPEFFMLDSPKHGQMITYSVVVQLMKPVDQLKVTPELSWSS